MQGSPALGSFYICTDGDTHPYKEGYALLWEEMDRFAVGLGLASVLEKFHLPQAMILCHTCEISSFIQIRYLLVYYITYYVYGVYAFGHIFVSFDSYDLKR